MKDEPHGLCKLGIVTYEHDNGTQFEKQKTNLKVTQLAMKSSRMGKSQSLTLQGARGLETLESPPDGAQWRAVARRERKGGSQKMTDCFLMPFLSKVDLTGETQGFSRWCRTAGGGNHPMKQTKNKIIQAKNPKTSHHSNDVVEAQRSGGADPDVICVSR